MYQVIIDQGWSSESLFEEYQTEEDALQCLNTLISGNVFETNRVTIIKQ